MNFETEDGAPVEAPAEAAPEQGANTTPISDIDGQDATPQASVEVPRPEGVNDFRENAALIDWGFDVMSSYDPDYAGELRARWGADAPANLQHAKAFGEAYPDLVQLAASKGLGDHPMLIEMAAMLGGRMASTPGDPSTVKQEARPPVMPDTQFDAQLEAVRESLEKAQFAGNSKKANQLYQDEMALIERQNGAGGIVNGRRTS